MKHHLPICHHPRRRGSTLVIVIGLLGILALTGMVFYTFASQEGRAAGNFVETAKATPSTPAYAFDHMLRQIITGPDESEKGSILYSPTRRHSLVQNMIGSDIYPMTGTGVDVNYQGGVPAVVDNKATIVVEAPELLDFVDSPVAREGDVARTTPKPDVDYTYPDINNVFLAYRGWAIRENPGPTYTQVPVVIPSFFRPQYMKSASAHPNRSPLSVVTDPYWAYPGGVSAGAITMTNRDTVKFKQRSFRPHPLHIGGEHSDGRRTLRYLTDQEAITLNVAAGGFPFLPANVATAGNDPAIQGELGILTGAAADVIELDVDNDGDGTKEGIWMDLRFPVQEHSDSAGNITNYIVLHSATIYDLDALFNLNAHGNLTGLPRDDTETLDTATSGGELTSNFLSRSNLGLGPNEINPIWGLRRLNPGVTDLTTDPPAFDPSFDNHFGRNPTTDLEQANMEWCYLKFGRGLYEPTPPTVSTLTKLLPGTFGDEVLLYNALQTRPTKRLIAELPRPGQAGDVYSSKSGVSFGGRNGFDDNSNELEGEPIAQSGQFRAFGHPLDYSGSGRHYAALFPSYNSATRQFDFPAATALVSKDPRLPLMLSNTLEHPYGPERWRSYFRYHGSATPAAPVRYSFGGDGLFTGEYTGVAGTGDDLNVSPVADALFEDPLEVIFDSTFADATNDAIFPAGDLAALQLSKSDIDNSVDDLSSRLTELASFAFHTDQGGEPIDNREMFSTLSNTLRHFGLHYDSRREWEFTADSDSDGFFEFPPKFGSVPVFDALDPFRPQVRSLLTNEILSPYQELVGTLPLSINHLLDVERTAGTPAEGTPAFVTWMQTEGMRFRSLTEHPNADPDAEGAAVLALVAADLTTLAAVGTFPPQTIAEREFWARRDRQQLARDIYVLLYTIGGAQVIGNDIVNYTQTNNSASIGAIRPRYSELRLRQMAQFAVNMVDAMDRDNVITRFEYDKNLGDGWKLDDLPWTSTALTDPASADTLVPTNVTANGLYPEDAGNRGVVFGVEAQQLAFSEVLGVRSPEIAAGDHPATPFDDQSGLRDFLYVELQNLLPQDLDLATSESTNREKAIWRLARFDRTVDGGNIRTAPDESIAILDYPGDLSNPLTYEVNRVNGGGRFTISVASDPGLSSSSLFVDLGDPVTNTIASFDGTYELVAPDVPDVIDTNDGNAADPLTDIDVNHSDHKNAGAGYPKRFEQSGTNFLENVVTYAGNKPFREAAAQLNDDPLGTQGFNAAAPIHHFDFGFDLVLQRRLNPNLPAVQGGLNPWVEIDRVRVLMTEFNLADGALPLDVFDPADLTKGVGRLKSTQRTEPLDDATRTLTSVAKLVTPHRLNTLKGSTATLNKLDVWGVNAANLTDPTNVVSVTNPAIPKELWQPHFDRDYASPAELLQLPVVGPNLVTQRLERMRYPAYQQIILDPLDAPDPASLISNAAAMFLFPGFTNTGTEKENRWYRLFQFVEVPSRVHRMLGNYLTQERLPGKLNLNMIRHLEVFAGMVDDPMFADLDATDTDRTTGPFLPDKTPQAPGIPVRDRWRDFIHERDRTVTSYYDPSPATPGVDGVARTFWIPGTPNAKPFRSLSHLNPTVINDNGLADTIFRQLDADIIDGAPATNRHWLEVGDSTFHQDLDAVANPLLDGGTTPIQRHQLLSKIMNNTTTVSNCFVVFATIGYFEAYQDSRGEDINLNSTLDPGEDVNGNTTIDGPTGFWRVGGRIDLDGTDNLNPGYEQRAVFVIDRTELLNAYDADTDDFDWERLIRYQAVLQ